MPTPANPPPPSFILYSSLNSAQLMPINILSLPGKDLQYALNCMDICELIAFSLCSNRTKNLVKPLNRKNGNIIADVYEYGIRLDISLHYQGFQSLILIIDFSNPWVKLDKENKYWRKQGFTHSDWIAHFLSIFDKTAIERLGISSVCPVSCLDTVKGMIPKCQTLRIRENCSKELIKSAFLKFCSISKDVQVRMNICDSENEISQFLTPNFRSLQLHHWENPFKLKLEDLLVINIEQLSIPTAIITEKELNRFLKLWMKSNHRFYRPKLINLRFRDGFEINREEVLKGIKCEDNFMGSNCAFRLKRKDGKELIGYVERHYINLEFV
ncbi:unnamed protein product [Caenorhabditis nigoni]